MTPLLNSVNAFHAFFQKNICLIEIMLEACQPLNQETLLSAVTVPRQQWNKCSMCGSCTKEEKPWWWRKTGEKSACGRSKMLLGTWLATSFSISRVLHLSCVTLCAVTSINIKKIPINIIVQYLWAWPPQAEHWPPQTSHHSHHHFSPWGTFSTCAFSLWMCVRSIAAATRKQHWEFLLRHKAKLLFIPALDSRPVRVTLIFANQAETTGPTPCGAEASAGGQLHSLPTLSAVGGPKATWISPTPYFPLLTIFALLLFNSSLTASNIVSICTRSFCRTKKKHQSATC